MLLSRGMKHILFPILALLGMVWQCSCSQMQQQRSMEPVEGAQKEELPPPLYLGSVHQVFSADKFALLRIIGPMPAEGTVLITHPADGSTSRMANLIVSSSQHARSNFVAADIRAGVVAQGDRVFQYRAIAAPIEPEEDTMPEPATFGSEELDLGYVPPAVQALREKARAARQEPPQEEEETGVQPAPVLPDEEEEDEAPAPQLPATPGIPHLDDIPDTIGGWDSM